MRGEVAGRETGYACLDLESGHKGKGSCWDLQEKKQPPTSGPRLLLPAPAHYSVIRQMKMGKKRKVKVRRVSQQ